MKLKIKDTVMKFWGQWLICLCLCLTSSVWANPPTDLRNVIDRFGTPVQHREFDKYGNQRFNPLLDSGAWHGFLLPDTPAGHGAFTGPLIIAEEYPVFIADALEKLQIRNAANGEVFDLASSEAKVFSSPGSLHQTLLMKDLSVQLDP